MFRHRGHTGQVEEEITEALEMMRYRTDLI